MAESLCPFSSDKRPYEPWTEEEDTMVRDLVQSLGTKRWIAIEDKLKAKFGVNGRTSKQIRERWHNHLHPEVKKGRWTVDEERLLYELHMKHGNRWALIAQQMPGRSDNQIKNHYYSTMRRSMRMLRPDTKSNKTSYHETEEIQSANTHTHTHTSGRSQLGLEGALGCAALAVLGDDFPFHDPYDEVVGAVKMLDTVTQFGKVNIQLQDAQGSLSSLRRTPHLSHEYSHTHTHSHPCGNTQIHTHTHPHTHTHAHTHTHTQALHICSVHIG
eukprot:GHVR01165926.1.p1 GENE.GHVR01165926.1~~GHVR01165926.1.p1  ORF type:complete len:271 (+),score=115.48 GHVR01165926.1:69-881(+)